MIAKVSAPVSVVSGSILLAQVTGPAAVFTRIEQPVTICELDLENKAQAGLRTPYGGNDERVPET
jgi:hypothetical protein